MRSFFLPGIAGMRRIGVIKSLPVNVLGMVGQMQPD